MKYQMAADQVLKRFARQIRKEDALNHPTPLADSLQPRSFLLLHGRRRRRPEFLVARKRGVLLRRLSLVKTGSGFFEIYQTSIHGFGGFFASLFCTLGERPLNPNCNWPWRGAISNLIPDDKQRLGTAAQSRKSNTTISVLDALTLFLSSCYRNP